MKHVQSAFCSDCASENCRVSEDKSSAKLERSMKSAERRELHRHLHKTVGRMHDTKIERLVDAPELPAAVTERGLAWKCAYRGHHGELEKHFFKLKQSANFVRRFVMPLSAQIAKMVISYLFKNTRFLVVFVEMCIVINCWWNFIWNSTGCLKKSRKISLSPLLRARSRLRWTPRGECFQMSRY